MQEIYRVWIRLVGYWQRIDYNYKITFFVIAVGIIAAAVWEYKKKMLNQMQSIGIALISIYSILILTSTVLSRLVMPEKSINLNIMETVVYRATFNIDTKLELVFNILMLLPCGLFLPLCSKKMIIWKVLVFGVCFSFIIEISQYLSQRGTFELTDLIENSCGVVIGYIIMVCVVKVKRKWFEKKSYDEY